VIIYALFVVGRRDIVFGRATHISVVKSRQGFQLLSITVQTGAVAKSPFDLMGTESLFREQSGQGVMLTMHLLLVLRVRGAMPLLPPICLHGLHKDKFTFCLLGCCMNISSSSVFEC
jgi:hypothetical protein